jgi:Protein of unknown function (DUF2795)
MTEHPTRTANPSRKEIEAALSSLDFPLAKEEIVACVTAQQSDEAVLRQLRALPLSTYSSVDEVLRAVDVADSRGR